MNLILLGPPGSGKGTQAKMLFEKYDLMHISTGETFRELLKTNNPLAKEVKKYVERGLFVPDDIVMKVVSNRVDQGDCIKNGFLLDGFPRNLSQAKFLNKHLTQKDRKIDNVIYLELSNQTIIDRLSSRFICPSCGANYNLISQPPKSDKKCDSCGAELVQRKDDMVEVVKRRLDIYKNETFPLIKYYKMKKIPRSPDSIHRGYTLGHLSHAVRLKRTIRRDSRKRDFQVKHLLVKINAENNVEEVFKDICNAINNKS